MENSHLASIKARFGIIGNSPLLIHAISIAEQVAPTDMTVLITGESGSGKESFSKIIHSLSKRKHGQFIWLKWFEVKEEENANRPYSTGSVYNKYNLIFFLLYIYLYIYTFFVIVIILSD